MTADFAASSTHACFSFGVIAGIAICAVVASLVGWILVIATESEWKQEDQ